MAELAVVEEEIPHGLDGQRIDRVVSFIAGLSRSQAVVAVDEGRVSINGTDVTKASERVSVGDCVSITVVGQRGLLVGDDSVPISVVHEDSEVIVVNKQAGLVVHPGAGSESQTMVHGLLARYPDLIKLRELEGQADRPGIVHRLDRGTSGLLMVARTAQARTSLSRQLRNRSVNRRYVSLVNGHMEAESGVIDAPLGRSSRAPTTRAVVAGGKPARTHYEVRGRYTAPDSTLVDVRLETGRTHQIRAHFTAVGHRVVGDRQYGDGDEMGLGRPFLHAARLGFEHPTSGEWMEFTVDLPEDLEQALAGLTGYSG